MITQLTLANVASYRVPALLETDKKTNLIYGLNGAGKSTLSKFLYDRRNPIFSSCGVVCGTDDEILVYNQSFIADFFHEEDKLRGIFTLSKENKDAEAKIKEHQQKLGTAEANHFAKTGEIAGIRERIERRKKEAEEACWKIKSSHAGGDRVLEYCLAGRMGSKAALYAHLKGIPLPSAPPDDTPDKLKGEITALQGNEGVLQARLAPVSLRLTEIEADPIFAKVIVGNENSTVAALIKEVGNADWVRSGLQYLPTEPAPKAKCPFCQEQTVTDDLVKRLRDYFDQAFMDDMDLVTRNLEAYRTQVDDLPPIADFDSHPMAAAHLADLTKAHSALAMSLSANLSAMRRKQQSPATSVRIVDTNVQSEAFNAVVARINLLVDAHNSLLQNKAAALTGIKERFWRLMRWDYDQTISGADRFESEESAKVPALEASAVALEQEVATHRAAILENQKKTVNVEGAVENINRSLAELGIEGFSIGKHSEHLYRIVRPGDSRDEFHSLSEGEKTIITFLYFVELCKGLQSAGSIRGKRIAVIDDPVSSLSHLFIFHLGRIIRREFCDSPAFEQVFILTHSLYFFYELTDTNHERRKEHQNLFRITKSPIGSTIAPMRYEEVQNDYQAYWSVVKEPAHHPALLANCMRNIIEYFFNFVEKRDFNNVFNLPKLAGTKFQAFNRFMNRESHSLGQNILDMKEFDYEVFKEGLKIVFTHFGYDEHYKAMMK
jgi:wobble nucleotide-excising tRNase